MKQPKACIFGGTGFVGRHLIQRLGEAGYRCLVPSRRPHRHRDLKLYPSVELRELTEPNTGNLADCLWGCDLAVNLVGILNESRGTGFEQVHVELARRIAAASARTGVPRLLHLSALHADAERGSSAYLRSKGAGEDTVHRFAAEGLAVTSFRPSVVFGRGDSFFNRFAQLLDWAPGILPLACPDARFAPVWVGDVAEAMVRSIDRADTAGQRYDLCGPRIFTLSELVEYTAQRVGKRLLLAHLNDKASRLQAKLMGALPGAPLTLDNYLSMQTPSVCTEHNGLLELGLHPTDIEAVVPTYLG